MTTSEYHKIETILERDPKTFRVIEGAPRLPEFYYLWDAQWQFTEKVDGTNVRVTWRPGHVLGTTNQRFPIRFGGKTDSAQVPTFLLARLQDLFSNDKFEVCFPDVQFHEVVLYGEGYGAKIQKGGGNYKSDGVDFVLFDVLVGEVFLDRNNMVDVADKLGIRYVPLVGHSTLTDAVVTAKEGFKSRWGDFPAEGLVLRPSIELRNRLGNRIIGKIKTKDFVGGRR